MFHVPVLVGVAQKLTRQYDGEPRGWPSPTCTQILSLEKKKRQLLSLNECDFLQDSQSLKVWGSVRGARLSPALTEGCSLCSHEGKSLGVHQNPTRPSNPFSSAMWLLATLFTVLSLSVLGSERHRVTRPRQDG